MSIRLGSETCRCGLPGFPFSHPPLHIQVKTKEEVHENLNPNSSFHAPSLLVPTSITTHNHDNSQPPCLTFDPLLCPPFPFRVSPSSPPSPDRSDFAITRFPLTVVWMTTNLGTDTPKGITEEDDDVLPPFPSKDSNVTAFDYFNQPYFFVGNVFLAYFRKKGRKEGAIYDS